MIQWIKSLFKKEVKTDKIPPKSLDEQLRCIELFGYPLKDYHLVPAKDNPYYVHKSILKKRKQ